MSDLEGAEERLIHLRAAVALAIQWLGCVDPIDQDREDPQNPGFVDEFCHGECVRCELNDAFAASFERKAG